jgi:hypothetical protein
MTFSPAMTTSGAPPPKAMFQRLRVSCVMKGSRWQAPQIAEVGRLSPPDVLAWRKWGC